MNTLEGKGLSQWHREHLKSIVICEEIVDSFPLFERLPLCIHMIERKGAGVWCPMKRRQIATMHHHTTPHLHAPHSQVCHATVMH